MDAPAGERYRPVPDVAPFSGPPPRWQSLMRSPWRVASMVTLVIAVVLLSIPFGTQASAAIHVLAPFIPLGLTAYPTLYPSILAMTVIRWGVVQLCAHLIPYPSHARRRMSLVCTLIESGVCIALMYDTPKSGAFSTLILVLVTSWLVLASDLWLVTSQHHLQLGEQRLLKMYSSVRTKTVSIAGMSTLVVLDEGDNREDKPILVCGHGYASGKALFASSLSTLSVYYRIYCIDWLGFGLSDRNRQIPSHYDVADIEQYFVDSLEAWRTELAIDKFYLLGHSMGGYLAACYATKHPEHVTHLFLVSPVGVPLGIVPEEQPGVMRRFLTLLWDNARLSPNIALNFLGPLAPRTMRWVCQMRFGQLMPADTLDALADYVFHLNAGPSLVGDRAISRLLYLGAFPRVGLAPRLADLHDIPITFLYGELDWMDRTHAASVLERRGGAAKHCHIYVIPNAGHQIFLMNPDAFCRVIIHEGIDAGKQRIPPLTSRTEDGNVFFVEFDPEPQ